MLEVCSVIGGALILFVALMWWASGGQFKSENDTDIVLAAVTLLVSVDVGFTVDVLVLVPSNRRVAVLRSMFVGAVVGWAKAMAGFAIMAAIGKTRRGSPSAPRSWARLPSRGRKRCSRDLAEALILGRRDRGAPAHQQERNRSTPILSLMLISRSSLLLLQRKRSSPRKVAGVFFAEIGVGLEGGRSGNDGQLDGEFGFAGYGFE